MAGVGALVAVLLYFGFAIGLAGSALTRLDEQDPPPGASPWRLRAPRLTLWAAPVLFIAAIPMTAASAPVGAALLLASLAAPSLALVMTATEWLRRRRGRRLAPHRHPADGGD